jgi:hypothetical protein
MLLLMMTVTLFTKLVEVVEHLELMVILALVTQSQMVHPAEEVLNT